jgi:hypothetical protein
MWEDRRSKNGNWKIEIGKSPELLFRRFCLWADFLCDLGKQFVSLLHSRRRNHALLVLTLGQIGVALALWCAAISGSTYLFSLQSLFAQSG